MRCNPPQEGFPSPCGLGSARRSSAGSGFVNAHPHRTGEDQMPFPSPTNSATLIGKLTRDPELRTVSTSAGERSVLTLVIAVRKPVKTDQDGTPTADFFDVAGAVESLAPPRRATDSCEQQSPDLAVGA